MRPPLHTGPYASRQLSWRTLCVLEPKAHVHLAVQRGGGGEVLASLVALARAPVERAETEVAMSDERAHAQLAGERERLAIRGFSVSAAARRCDVTGEAEGVGLGAASPQPPGERQGLSCVAGGLVDPPGREAGRSRVQKDDPGSAAIQAIAVFDGTHDQRERLISTAGEGVGGAESRGDDRYPVDELPRPAEVEASLEDPGRAWEISAAEVGAAEIEQPVVQRQGMISGFSDPHSRVRVLGGLVEPAELGEHVGEDSTARKPMG